MHDSHPPAHNVYATFARGIPLARDRQTRSLSVPLTLHGLDGDAVGESALRLDGVDAELLHAALTRLLESVDQAPRVS
ncbi:hypothetical protein [Yinghuangia soli]|uniref:Uncharacterized protein n=1 Tax=Yinghuangia soli TaxID=2908204 RepID=A0AA41U8L1_9ACTN|nr:hypothetical protein [Yinghuangia soli]MCF2533009.1 hypothetical protein [Yinghuangia soli]